MPFQQKTRVLYQRYIILVYLLRNFRRLINEKLSFYVQVKGVQEAENTVKLTAFFQS